MGSTPCPPASGRKWVGNDPSHDSTRCFQTFPFPNLDPSQEAELDRLGEALDTWPWRVLDAHPDVHLTLLYNIVAKLRAGEALTPAELALHRRVGTSALVELHEAIDAAVLEAYGFEGRDEAGILEGLVALNAARAAEEAAGTVRPLGLGTGPATLEKAAAKKPRAAERPPWPKDPIDQIAAVLARFQRVDASSGGLTTEAVRASFIRGPKDDRIQTIVERLHQRGLLRRVDGDAFRLP